MVLFQNDWSHHVAEAWRKSPKAASTTADRAPYGTARSIQPRCARNCALASFCVSATWLNVYAVSAMQKTSTPVQTAIVATRDRARSASTQAAATTSARPIAARCGPLNESPISVARFTSHWWKDVLGETSDGPACAR